jgi:hypothetical protein
VGGGEARGDEVLGGPAQPEARLGQLPAAGAAVIETEVRAGRRTT